jgi:hypothetical protein
MDASTRRDGGHGGALPRRCKTFRHERCEARQSDATATGSCDRIHATRWAMDCRDRHLDESTVVSIEIRRLHFRRLLTSLRARERRRVRRWRCRESGRECACEAFERIRAMSAREF